MTNAVKFADGSDSIIEGLAIPYGGSRKGKDLHGEDFGPDTDLALDWFPDEGRPFLFHHGLDDAVKTTLVGRQTEREERDIGQWVRVQLDKRSKYMDAIRELVDKEALSFSSGAIPHLVQTRKDGHIERWPWVELSGTPTPAEPGAVMYAVKTADAIEHLTAVKAAEALKSIFSDDEVGSEPEPFDVEARRVSGSVKTFLDRAEARVEARAKAKRDVSATNRETLQALYGALDPFPALRERVRELLHSSDPEAQKAIEDLETELLVSELRRSGLPV